MGTFTDSRPDVVERRRSNHRRTAYFTVMIETKYIDTVKEKVAAAADTVHVEWVDDEGDMSELLVGYGPVYGSFRSDVERLFEERWGIPLVADPEFVRADHADDCDHHSHNS